MIALGPKKAPPLEPADEPSPEQVATVIRTLGEKLISVYRAAVLRVDTGDQRQRKSFSKQREQLLIALIREVAQHAEDAQRRNAALSATDAAIARLSAQRFEDRTTRSRRDRRPIKRNISKVVAEWLRWFKRLPKQNKVDATLNGSVELEGVPSEWHLTLSFSYPRRLTKNRRLLIAVALERRVDGAWRASRFPSDVKAATAELPEPPPLTSNQAQILRGLLMSLDALAAETQNPELQELATAGMKLSVPIDRQKALGLALCALLAVSALTTLAGEALLHYLNRERLRPLAEKPCTPTPRVLLRFPRPPRGGIHVFQGGRELPREGNAYVDTQPRLGTSNSYEIRATNYLLLPWIEHTTVEMPACRPCNPPCAPPDTQVFIGEQPGTFDLTRDKTGPGDRPTATATIDVRPADQVNTLEVFTNIIDPYRELSRSTTIYSNLVTIQDPDVKVVVKFGDRETPVTLFSAAAVHVGREAYEKIGPVVTPQIFSTDNVSSEGGRLYAVEVPHNFQTAGTYTVTVTAYSRPSSSVGYRFVKQLKRRFHIGVKTSVETKESYHLPTQTTTGP